MNPDLDGWIVPEKNWSSTPLKINSSILKMMVLGRWFSFSRVFLSQVPAVELPGCTTKSKKVCSQISMSSWGFLSINNCLWTYYWCFISLDFLGVSGSWNLSLGSKFGSIGQARLLPTTWITHREGLLGEFQSQSPRSVFCQAGGYCITTLGRKKMFWVV